MAVVVAPAAQIASPIRGPYDDFVMRWLADFVYLLAGILYFPAALYNALIVGKNRRGWKQRFGGVPRFDTARPRIWIHAVSLGEINATPKLVEALQARMPGVDIVFSSTTDTGHARGAQLYGADRIFRFPLDFSLVMARALDRIRPSLIVLVELEAWPNLIRLATSRSIPVAVVNGRLTERSARRLKWLAPAVRPMFADLAWIGAQDATIAERFLALGAKPDRVEVTSSLKWDTAVVADGVEGDAALAAALGIEKGVPVWVCGSTGPGEEEIILDAYRAILNGVGAPTGRARNRTPGPWTGTLMRQGTTQGMSAAAAVEPAESDPVAPLLAIVPRKPERFDEVARVIDQAGFACIRRSRRADGSASSPATDCTVILGDSMGELRKFYSLASVVFVGRSLVPLGGSDPMEVAALGRPILVGPHTDNFAEPMRILQQAGCISRVDSAMSLAVAVAGLLAESEDARSGGRRARETVAKNQGATQRSADRLAALLGG